MTWTDLAAELTADQIALLQEYERHGWTNLPLIAQGYATENRLRAQYAHVPLPADATEAYEWYQENGDAQRWFWGTRRGTAVSVKIGGHQHGDGSVGGRVIHVDTGTGGAEMTLAEAS
jgi:hypothetical protein